MLKCAYKQSAGAGDSATMPPPLHRSCDETCYMNGNITTLNKCKPLIRIKLIKFNNEKTVSSLKICYILWNAHMRGPYICVSCRHHTKSRQWKFMKILELSHIFSAVWRLHFTPQNIFSPCRMHRNVMNFVTSHASWHIHIHHNGIFCHLQHSMLQTSSLHNGVQYGFLMSVQKLFYQCR